MRSKYVKVKKISDYITKKVADKLAGLCKTDKESYEKSITMKEEKISVAKKSNLPEQKNASLKETWPPACKLKESQ